MKKIIILAVIPLLLTACMGKNQSNNMFVSKNIRQAAFAGQFYPANADELRKKIDKYLAGIEESDDKPVVKAIMVPHAGYDYSGQVAAYGYKKLVGQAVGTAVIICNSHAGYFSGLALDDADAWQTPLGAVEIDKELAEALLASNSSIKYNSSVFGQDHTLEVQLPFLQVVLAKDFKILPIYFGNQDGDYAKLAQVLADNLGENDIVIASSDMSHYPSYEDAKRIDQITLKKIQAGGIAKLDEYIDEAEAQNIAGEQTLLCGIDGVKTVMKLANARKWSSNILYYANSGDVVIGGKKSVVGYGAVAYEASQKQQDKNLNQEQKDKLLDIAKQTIESYVKNGKVPNFDISDERLNWREGAFVTLEKNGELRGCIGQIIPTEKPLWQVVRDMAIAAATEDNRFSPVGADELNKITYEISVLSAPERIDSWQKIELGKHGVIIKSGLRSGVFLPQVADETGWSKEEFLSQLCWQKAGLAPDCYKNKETEISIFTAQVFSD